MVAVPAGGQAGRKAREFPVTRSTSKARLRALRLLVFAQTVLLLASLFAPIPVAAADPADPEASPAPTEPGPRAVAAYALARTLASRAPLDELLRAALTAARELFDADEVALVVAPDSELAARVSRLGVSASAPAGARPGRRSVTSAAVCCAPIVISGQPLGVVKLTNPRVILPGILPGR